MDTYFDTNHSVTRLYREWQKHPKLIVACDFDDTLYDCHGRGQSHLEVIELLKRANAHGFYVVIFTASQRERYDFIHDYVHKLGIKIDGINKNILDMGYGMGTNGKIYANIFLDDRAGLFQAATTLLKLFNKIESENKL